MNTKTPHSSVRNIFGVDFSEVKNKKHNIWVGVSFSNKNFNEESLESLIRFALEYTKEKVLVVIPGRMQATNYRYFENLRRSEALRKAFSEEDIYVSCVEKIIERLKPTKPIVIANYDAVCTPKHIKQREIFFREFSKQSTFYDSVMSVVGSVFTQRKRTFDTSKGESLALYVLHELPFFIDGVQKIEEPTRYTVNVYPGSGGIDELVLEIRKGEKFSELTKKLNIENETGIIDVAFTYEH